MTYEPADPADLDRLRALGWEIGADSIKKSFKFKSFSAAWAWMNKAAEKAEEVHHHPDWSNSYNRVVVTLTTHATGGLSHLDVELALFMEAALAA